MTAVEFIFEQFFKVKWEDMPSKPIVFEQALEMEKEQIINAHLAGQNSAEEVDGQTEIQYYNETFRKN